MLSVLCALVTPASSPAHEMSYLRVGAPRDEVLGEVQPECFDISGGEVHCRQVVVLVQLYDEHHGCVLGESRRPATTWLDGLIGAMLARLGRGVHEADGRRQAGVRAGAGLCKVEVRTDI